VRTVSPSSRFLALAASAVSVLTLVAARPVGAQAFAPSTTVVTLRAGDVMRVTVWRRPELSGEFVVAANGALAHPLYRELVVAGVPLDSVERRLHVLLERYESNPQFVVEPLLRIAVGGEVGRPNIYTLRPETSVSEAIALAGGPTERGRADQARLTRGGRTILLDFSRPESGHAMMPLVSGDQLVVERRRSMFREYIAPAITVTGATAAILNVILRNDRR
jgi:polysaccharide biosynthesis/export protein